MSPVVDPDRSGARGDPVLARRYRIDRWARFAQRLGYLLYAGALAVFFMGLAGGLGAWTTRILVALLVGGSAVLAPAILVAYAVKAAVRHDREHGWDTDSRRQ